MQEPELITIIEGPTPEFQPSPYRWLQTIHEGPEDQATAVCELRTANGPDIQARCQRAWRAGRPVKLDYPDAMRMRQRIDVIALRQQAGTISAGYAGSDNPIAKQRIFQEIEYDEALTEPA